MRHVEHCGLPFTHATCNQSKSHAHPAVDYELTSPPPPRYEPSGAGIDPELERLLEQDPGLIDVKSKSFTQFGGDSRVGEGFDSSATWFRGARFPAIFCDARDFFPARRDI